MKYITFNNKKISKLSLGTVQFGLDYGIANQKGKPTQDEVNKIIDYVYNNGINCFDTAQAYGDSEKVLGKAIKDKKDSIIVSKLKSELFENNSIQNITKTLTNLQQKKIFGLLLHDSQLLFKWNKKHYSLVQQLKKNKKISYFGVSIYTDKEFDLALENENIELIQIPFNLLDQRAIINSWLKRAKEKNKLIFIRSIYLQGLILMDIDKVPNHLKKAKKYLKIIKNLANELNITKNELALSFVDQIAKDSVLLFGCDNLNQAIQNIKNYNNLLNLDDEVIKYIITNFSNIDEYIYNPIKWSK